MARTLFHKDRVPYRRERIATPDDDFLDLDWLPATGAAAGDAPLAVFCHGLEGDSSSSYIPLTIKALQAVLGWPCLAWNYRSCSGEMNRQARFYYLGETDDLHTVLEHARRQGHRRFVLIGFSAGGSIALNYLGKRPADARALGVAAAAAISAPLDLTASVRRLEEPGSMFYNRRFCTSLVAKAMAKAQRMGSRFPLDLSGLKQVRDLRTFDSRVTAPLHGFASSDEYYARCSGLPLLSRLEVPTLLWNARNDPFLSSACYPPEAQAGTWPLVQARFPEEGGHCGYALCQATELIRAAQPGGLWQEALHSQFP